VTALSSLAADERRGLAIVCRRFAVGLMSVVVLAVDCGYRGMTFVGINVDRGGRCGVWIRNVATRRGFEDEEDGDDAGNGIVSAAASLS
jgi:hypothetical protein